MESSILLYKGTLKTLLPNEIRLAPENHQGLAEALQNSMQEPFYPYLFFFSVHQEKQTAIFVRSRIIFEGVSFHAGSLILFICIDFYFYFFGPQIEQEILLAVQRNMYQVQLLPTGFTKDFTIFKIFLNVLKILIPFYRLLR